MPGYCIAFSFYSSWRKHIRYLYYYRLINTAPLNTWFFPSSLDSFHLIMIMYTLLRLSYRCP
jgi:hypothetical protein